MAPVTDPKPVVKVDPPQVVDEIQPPIKGPSGAATVVNPPPSASISLPWGFQKLIDTSVEFGKKAVHWIAEHKDPSVSGPSIPSPEDSFNKEIEDLYQLGVSQRQAGQYEEALKTALKGKEMLKQYEWALTIRNKVLTQHEQRCGDFNFLVGDVRREMNTLRGREVQLLHKIRTEGKTKEVQEELEWIQKGIAELKYFDQNFSVMGSISFSGSTREKLVQGYLERDTAKVERAHYEMKVLYELKIHEGKEEGLFNYLAQEYGNTSYLGYLRPWSLPGEDEPRDRLEGEVKALIGVDSPRGPFEPDLLKIMTDQDPLNNPSFLEAFRRLEENYRNETDPQKKKQLGEKLQLVEKGIRRVISVEDQQHNIKRLRRPDSNSPPSLKYYPFFYAGVESPYNDFKISATSYEEVEKVLAEQKGELNALIAFIQTDVAAVTKEKTQKTLENEKANPSFAHRQNLGKSIQHYDAASARLKALEDAVKQAKASSDKVVNWEMAQKMFLGDLQAIRDDKKAVVEAMKAQFKKNFPKYADNLKSEEDWAKALAAGGPWEDSREYEMIKGAVFSVFSPMSSAVAPIQRPLAEMKWAELSKACQELNAFETNVVPTLTTKIQQVDSFEEAQALTREMFLPRGEVLDRSLDELIKDTRKMAFSGRDEIPMDEVVRLSRFEVERKAILEEKDPKVKIQKAKQLIQDIQNYSLGVSIALEIKMTYQMEDHADSWEAMKGVVGAGDMFGNGDTFHPYRDHLAEAQKLYKAGKFEAARKIFAGLTNSPQRNIIIEKGKDSALYFGLVIGIGIVALSALTAGAATELLLPAAGKIGFALSAGRFVLNASVFWGTSEGLNALVYDRPFAADPHTGKSHVVGSYFENLLFFGALLGISKAYQSVVRSIVFSRASALYLEDVARLGGKAAEGGLAKLPRTLQDLYVGRALKGLSGSSKALIKAGGFASEIVGLNAWSALTDPNYKVFSLKTQGYLLTFVIGLKAISPLSERFIAGLSESRRNLVEKQHLERVKTEIQKLDQEGIALAQEMATWNGAAPTLSTREKQKKGEEIIGKMTDLAQRRLDLMEKNPYFFETDFIITQRTAFEQLNHSKKVFAAQAKIFESGNRFGMTSVHDTYAPSSGTELIKHLPEIFGETKDLKTYYSVHPNGTIEVTPVVTEGGRSFTLDPFFIRPKRQPTRSQIESMQKAIPNEKRFFVGFAQEKPVTTPDGQVVYTQSPPPPVGAPGVTGFLEGKVIDVGPEAAF